MNNKKGIKNTYFNILNSKSIPKDEINILSRYMGEYPLDVYGLAGELGFRVIDYDFTELENYIEEKIMEQGVTIRLIFQG